MTCISSPHCKANGFLVPVEERGIVSETDPVHARISDIQQHLVLTRWRHDQAASSLGQRPTKVLDLVPKGPGS